ncbi:MAG: DUF1998 domain-containing protein [Clostridia bacterium]|nr:DUF1998 domain-containing protein [Clostridia bacterium]
MANNKYSIRRDSLISPWGVGAIVPFPHDESLMVSGLDFWFDEDHSYEDFLINDERLSRRLGGKQFVMPPDFREFSQDAQHAEMRIPAVRFPLWHYCPVCGNMEQIGTAGERQRCTGEIRKTNGKETYCFKNKGKPKNLPILVPERFIAVCKKGHIEDFPVMEWVHKKSDKPITSSCKLVRSTGGSSASLSGIRYTCTCGATATMNGAFGWDSLEKIGYTCTGNQPWLGANQKVDCGEPLLVLQRGASNVWFADVISSVYIPWLPKYKNQNTKECIERGVKKFASSRTNGSVDEVLIKKFVLQNQMIDEDIDDEQAFDEIIATLNNTREGDTPQSEDEYRKQEFDVLTSTAGNSKDELYCINYSATEYEKLDFLKSISLVHKLRETRVFQGFKRITLDDTSFSAQISVKEISWLPAVKNSGEGIMFEFDYEKLYRWSSEEKISKRVNIIEQNMKNTGKLTTEKLNPIYILLHTFAHCLINALSSESGYSNASIRERIYCSKYLEKESSQMAGVLIYTASGDSEGSLGGLVRQGLPGRIENVIKMAISEAKWCAADPVCIQSTGQGQYGCNLAACHNCALLPETSCENKNMLLDRGLLIGTLDDTSIGYFSGYEED